MTFQRHWATTIVLIGAALASCTASAPRPAETASSATIVGQTSFDAEQCTSIGGQVERRGLLGSPMCVRRLEDAGKSCQGSKDCKGKCLVAPGQPSVAVPLGTPVKGICQAEEPLFGCFALVEQGKLASRRRCVD